MRKIRITVIGTGYVGLTTGACMASLGHTVICADYDAAKVAALRRGEVDILEPGLEELVAKGISSTHLQFTTRTLDAVIDADAVFLCLPTPTSTNGSADLSAVHAVTEQVRPALKPGCVLVVKSTVPIGASTDLVEVLNRTDVPVVTNPEFLREGTAVQDFLRPDRILIGCTDLVAGEWVAHLYRNPAVPTIITGPRTAEMAKYASNCFLAMKISYINSIAELSGRLGADARTVATVMGHDPRIAQAHLKPGPGWGGSCLPKDTTALLDVATKAGFDFQLLRATVDSNRAHQEEVARRIFDRLPPAPPRPRVGILGLTFKAKTNDLRDSPAVAVARMLTALGADVTAYDPAIRTQIPGVVVVDDPYLVAKGAGCVAILTEWEQFRALDWSLIAELMDGDLVVDTRNMLDGTALRALSLRWEGIGAGDSDSHARDR